MITLDNVDLSGLDQKLRQIAKITKEEPAKLMKQEARLLCVELAKYTQPFGLDENAKKLGEGAVKSDLLGNVRGRPGGQRSGGVFYVIPDALANSAHQEKTGNVRIFSRKDGFVYGTDSDKFKTKASNSELEEHHKSMRGPDGSVTQAGGKTRDIGRWKFIQRWVITQSQFTSYLAFAIRRVGFAKGGWATCAAKLGGTRGIPAWITKHKTPGTVIDATGGPEPKITIRNDVNYTSQVLSESNLKAALRDREIKLTARIEQALKAKFKGLR
jgi:hypothetical protein